MASLWALLTAPQAVGAFTWLTRLAARETSGNGNGGGTGGNGNAGTRRADAGTGAMPAAESPRPVQPVAPGKPLIQVVILYSTLTGATTNRASWSDTARSLRAWPVRSPPTVSGGGWSPTRCRGRCSITAAAPTTRPSGSPTT